MDDEPSHTPPQPQRKWVCAKVGAQIMSAKFGKMAAQRRT
jgi:hypothetical protein